MKVEKQKVIDACELSGSMTEASLLVPEVNFQTFRRYAKALNVWRPNQAGKGLSKAKSEGKGKFSLDDILSGKFPGYSSHKLRLRLISCGKKKDCCELCGIGNSWNGKKLSMQLDHIDGNPRNHSLQNLRILCPNCHSQTETFGSKNIKNAPVAELVDALV